MVKYPTQGDLPAPDGGLHPAGKAAARAEVEAADGELEFHERPGRTGRRKAGLYFPTIRAT